MLYIAGKPITRNIAKELRYAWTSQDLREYMTDKFKWKKTTADLIDWYSHGSTLQSYDYYQHLFCVKLIHERLPVLGEKFTASPDKTCPCCTICDETTSHYMKCNLNPHTVDELRDGLKPVFNKHDVDPILRIFIYMATAHQPITQEILEDLHPIIDFSPYSELLLEQDEIGWNQLLLGRYGIKWDQCQRRYLENKHQKPITGEPKWIRNVIRETWKYQKARWSARNEELHGTSNGPNSSAATKLALLTRIRTLYTHEMTLLQQDRVPFNIEIEDWEHKTCSAMQQWLTRNTPFIRHALKIAKIQLKTNASDIRRFMPNAPILKTTTKSRTKVKRRRGKTQSKDITQFTQKQTPKQKQIHTPTPLQSRILFPKQYKQATILAFTTKRTQQQTAQPDNHT